jgi:hypothetical protein
VEPSGYGVYFVKRSRREKRQRKGASSHVMPAMAQVVVSVGLDVIYSSFQSSSTLYTFRNSSVHSPIA